MRYRQLKDWMVYEIPDSNVLYIRKMHPVVKPLLLEYKPHV